MQFSSSVFLVISSIALPAALACGGYKLDIQELKNCGGGSDIIQLEDGFTSQLTDDCQVKPQGCVTTKQDIQQAMITYDVLKNGMIPLKGTTDACKEMQSADEKTVELVMTLVGIPPSCPIPQGQRCANDSSIDVSSHKPKMPAAAGSYKGRVTTDHGEGLSTCIQFQFSLNM